MPVRTGEVLRAAGLLSAHTFAVTTVSRRETLGASSAVPLAALGAVGAIASAVGGAFASGGRPSIERAFAAQVRPPHPRPPHLRPAHAPAAPVRPPWPRTPSPRTPWSRTPWLSAASAAAYAVTGGRPLAQAMFNPSPPLLQRAVGGGIRATIPLQAALAVRAGRPGAAAAVLAMLPGAVRLSRRVSPT
jgi:4-hydroxybenzoate polyprenyltransferase